MYWAADQYLCYIYILFSTYFIACVMWAIIWISARIIIAVLAYKLHLFPKMLNVLAAAISVVAGWASHTKFHSPLFPTLFLIDDILNRYDEASADLKPYRQKDGALLAIGTLCDKLKQTDPYKSELERMLVQHVFPEFNSRVGHLRAKVECSGNLFCLLIFYCVCVNNYC
jgi:hypothetical protein